MERKRFLKQWMEDQLADFLVDVIKDFLDSECPEGPEFSRKEINDWLYYNELIMRG